MTESLLKIPKRYCYKITQGASMKSLVALWVFLLFLSVSYGEEYKCLNVGTDFKCVYFESEAKYDTTHLHCKDKWLADIFRGYNETIKVSSERPYDDRVNIGNKQFYDNDGIFFGKIGLYDEGDDRDQRYIPDVRNPTELGKVLIKREIERIKVRVKERDELLQFLLDNNLCKIVEF